MGGRKVYDLILFFSLLSPFILEVLAPKTFNFKVMVQNIFRTSHIAEQHLFFMFLQFLAFFGAQMGYFEVLDQVQTCFEAYSYSANSFYFLCFLQFLDLILT